jgi:hypothetical protein
MEIRRQNRGSDGTSELKGDGRRIELIERSRPPAHPGGGAARRGGPA